MHVLTLYNRYRTRVHGEEAVVSHSLELLRARGFSVELLTEDSANIGDSLIEKLCAGTRAIYSLKAGRLLENHLISKQTDILHAHNIYPLFTPSALLAAARNGVPVALTLHHYFLTCPTLMHYRQGEYCLNCLPGRHYHSVLHNCRQSRAESLAYALRAAIARRLRWFHKSVSAFITLTRFSRSLLIEAGYPQDRIHVLPNAVRLPNGPPEGSDKSYIAYIGRLTEEKGIDDLIAAAALSGIPTKIAGNIATRADLVRRAPKNVEFVGLLRGERLAEFYRQAAMVVVPSRWFEGCPMVVLEAMSYGRPVVASNVGGMGELIVDNVTGRLFQKHNPEALADLLQGLWSQPEQRKRMGLAARAHVERHFNETLYADRLIAIYEKIRTNGCQMNHVQ